MSENKINDDEKTIRTLHEKTPFLNWGKLRFVGSVRVLSVMSFVGASIAVGLSLPQLAQVNIENIISNTISVWSFIFFFISLLFANLIHYIFCPIIIKKFLSLSDFYMHQINIKKCQLETYPEDQFDASLLHVAKEYIKLLSTRPFARWSSLFLFSLSIIFFFMFVVNTYLTISNDNYYIKQSSFNINFEYNTSELTNKEKEIVSEIIKKIKNNDALISVKGHTDEIISLSINQNLTLEILNVIKKYLIFQNKLNEKNIIVVVCGQLWPVAPNISEEGRKFNKE